MNSFFHSLAVCCCLQLLLPATAATAGRAAGFVVKQAHRHDQYRPASSCRRRHLAPQPFIIAATTPRTSLRSFFEDDDRDEDEIEEEARTKILESRRYQVRAALKSAEAVRNLRIKNGWIPERDEDGKPIKSDGKLAVTVTAFCVAAGAIALRIGGRAALVSAVGLDFVSDNPELKQNLDQVLNTADTMDLPTKLFLFTAGWTAVKVLCFDTGGIVLALASGILFGGVLQGAVISATAATIGSSISFVLAKIDSPFRKKAIEVLDEYPSLRGIEKVVAQDGLKAILTLRLAPILPLPIGLYNYIYGVTNVPYFDFAGGIFLGSLKPYLLDSYLGYFGKSVIDGTADGAGSFQDLLLLGALGLSVLIGVFASQLAGETWDSVLEEVEAEKKAKLGKASSQEDEEEELTREFIGIQLPEWMLDAQRSWKNAENIVDDIIVQEYQAKVWNYTKEEGGPPVQKDPANLPYSLEVTGANQGVDLGESVYVGLVLSPLLFQAFTKYADPLYDEEADELLQLANRQQQHRALKRRRRQRKNERQGPVDNGKVGEKRKQLQRLDELEEKIEGRIKLLDERIRDMKVNR